eukprot:jgi/Chlat1/1156/Chrsp112S00062
MGVSAPHTNTLPSPSPSPSPPPRAFTSIPVIDVSALPRVADDVAMWRQSAAVRAVADDIHNACRDVGFFYVTGHGVPKRLTRGVIDLARKFFALGDEEKQRIATTGSVLRRGYQKIGLNVTKGLKDWHEALDFMTELPPSSSSSSPPHPDPISGPNQWPTELIPFRPVYEEYIAELNALGKRLMRAISLGLTGGNDPLLWEKSVAEENFWILRAIGYPPAGFDIHARESDVGLGWCELGSTRITARNVRGEWVAAKPIPDTFVVNIGDMFKVWTNGEYEPTVHRVLTANDKYRVSVPFFYEPDLSAVVKPLTTLIKGQNGGYEGVCYGDHVRRKVSNNFKYDDV